MYIGLMLFNTIIKESQTWILIPDTESYVFYGFYGVDSPPTYIEN